MAAQKPATSGILAQATISVSGCKHLRKISNLIKDKFLDLRPSTWTPRRLVRKQPRNPDALQVTHFRSLLRYIEWQRYEDLRRQQRESLRGIVRMPKGDGASAIKGVQNFNEMEGWYWVSQMEASLSTFYMPKPYQLLYPPGKNGQILRMLRLGLILNPSPQTEEAYSFLRMGRLRRDGWRLAHVHLLLKKYMSNESMDSATAEYTGCRGRRQGRGLEEKDEIGKIDRDYGGDPGSALLAMFVEPSRRLTCQELKAAE